MLLDAVTEAMSCQHEQSFYQSDEGTEGFEKISLKQNINDNWEIGIWYGIFTD